MGQLQLRDGKGDLHALSLLMLPPSNPPGWEPGLPRLLSAMSLGMSGLTGKGKGGPPRFGEMGARGDGGVIWLHPRAARRRRNDSGAWCTEAEKKEKGNRGEKLRLEKSFWVSWVCGALPATLKSAARGRGSPVLAGGARVQPLSGDRRGRGGTRHDLLARRESQKQRGKLVRAIKY